MDDIFGEGFDESALSDDGACRCCSETQISGTQSVLQGTGIEGLTVIRGFLSHEGAEHLLAHILAQGWVSGGANNQAMAFGTLPPWVGGVQAALDGFLERHPEVGYPAERGFNQLIANRYEGAEGLKPHIDLLKFRDGIFGLTLCGTASFELSPCQPHHRAAAAGGCCGAGEAASQPPPAAAASESTTATFLMEPGDAYMLTGPARYDYVHGIPERGFDHDSDGKEIRRTMRISLTLRRLV